MPIPSPQPPQTPPVRSGQPSPPAQTGQASRSRYALAKKAPPAIRQYLFSPDLERAFDVLTARHGFVSPEKRVLLSDLVVSVLLGELHPNLFIRALADKTGMTVDQARKIAVDISAKVFSPVRNELLRMYRIDGAREKTNEVNEEARRAGEQGERGGATMPQRPAPRTEAPRPQTAPPAPRTQPFPPRPQTPLPSRFRPGVPARPTPPQPPRFDQERKLPPPTRTVPLPPNPQPPQPIIQKPAPPQSPPPPIDRQALESNTVDLRKSMGTE